MTTEESVVIDPVAVAEGAEKPVEVVAHEFMERLNVLLAKTASLSSSASLGKEAGLSKKRNTGTVHEQSRSRISEEDEDKQLLKMANDSNSFVWISSQPSIVTGRLRDYQIEGLNWMVRIHDTNINGILADEMGLGKTLQTISLLAYLHESRQCRSPALVIAPKSTISNWMKEFHRWCPSFRVVKLLGNKEERKATCKDDLLDPSSFDVVVASFESCLKEVRTLCHINWYYVVIDEAHRIKNESSELSKMVRKLNTAHRLLLTGTPLQVYSEIVSFLLSCRFYRFVCLEYG